MPLAASWMDLEIIRLGEGSQKVKYYIISMWNLKNSTNKLVYETETDSQTRKHTYGYQRGRERGINWEYGIYRCILHI